MAVAVGAALLLGACSADPPNHGGDTTCAEYVALAAGDREKAVKAMLESRGEVSNDGAVTLVSASVFLYCQTLAEDTDTIASVYGG
ncbi:MAG: hypothetical protein LBR33_03995 [Propionibacteriaceae bacterium]|nr:hypothetical protein [Propionibacteriaceae bacterium]